MRTTAKQLESAVEQYARLTGKNYILRHRDSRVGGYGVCIVYPERGHTQSSDIICGKASEVYNKLWAAIRAIEEYQQVQAEKPVPDGPQFIAVITDGFLQNIISLTGKSIPYLLIDEDAILIQAEEGGLELVGNLTNNEILKGEVTKGLETGEFARESDLTLSNRTASTITNALGYNL